MTAQATHVPRLSVFPKGFFDALVERRMSVFEWIELAGTLGLRVPALSPHFQCVLTRDRRLDSLLVRVERRPDADAADARRAGDALVHTVKSTIGVTVAVEVTDPGGVERSTGKMARIVDRR